MPPKAKPRETDKDLETQAADRPQRPLFAMLTASVEAQPVKDQATKTNGGRWGLNAGSLMITAVRGLNTKHDSYGAYAGAIRLVVDLSSATFAKKVMPALGEHWWDKIIGNWSNGEITAKGITADLKIYEARSEAEAAVIPEAIRAKALLDQGHPWQASIGAKPANGIADYEEIGEGEDVEVNGVTFTNDDPEMPLFVMRNGVVTEASICTFGADEDTGPLAASRRHGRLAASASQPTPKESSTMKYSLKVLLAAFAAHAGLVAEHVSAAQELPEDKQPTPEALQASIGAAVAKAELAAKDAEIAALKAAGLEKDKLIEAKGKAKGGVTAASATPPFQGDDGSDAPTSLHGAMVQLAGENPKLKGFSLRSAALKRWPELRKTVPAA